MAATPRNYDITQIHQGPGDIWVMPLTSAPSDSAQRLTLAADGSLDSVAHPTAVCLGLTEGAIAIAVKVKLSDIKADQFEAPIDTYMDSVDAEMSVTLEQQGVSLLQQVLSTGVYSTQASPGWNQLTAGGISIVPAVCVAAVTPKRTGSGLFVVSLLFRVASKGGVTISIGRAKNSSHKVQFAGQSDVTRTAGRQILNHYETT